MKNKHTILGLLLGIIVSGVVIYLISQQVAANRLDRLSLHTQAAVAEQQTLLVAIAEATARNGADGVTESIVKDCSYSERNEFDTLLGNLNNGLSTTELVTLERLFGRCGAFYAERKAVMVSRLTREIEVYKYYVEQLGLILGEDVTDAYNTDDWTELATKEQKISELFAELVSLQDQIISSLLAGNSPQSEELSSILLKASEVQETLAVTNTQAGTIRSKVLPL